MARQLTREERIEYLIYENRIANKSRLEQSRGYCEAFVDGEIACENAENAMKNWSYNKLSTEARQKREEFRARLAEAGFPEHTTYSSKVLEAYDKVHCPELRKKKPVVSFNTENYPDGVMVTVDGLVVYQK